MAQSKKSGAPATVILIDDDAALLSALRFDLELEGFRVCSYACAEDVPDEDLPTSDSCLIVDYRLPDLNGVQFLRRLRDHGVRLPAIVITTQPTRQLMLEAVEVGASIVEKPLLGDRLVTAIRSALAA